MAYMDYMYLAVWCRRKAVELNRSLPHSLFVHYSLVQLQCSSDVTGVIDTVSKYIIIIVAFWITGPLARFDSMMIVCVYMCVCVHGVNVKFWRMIFIVRCSCHSNSGVTETWLSNKYFEHCKLHFIGHYAYSTGMKMVECRLDFQHIKDFLYLTLIGE